MSMGIVKLFENEWILSTSYDWFQFILWTRLLFIIWPPQNPAFSTALTKFPKVVIFLEGFSMDGFLKEGFFYLFQPFVFNFLLIYILSMRFHVRDFLHSVGKILRKSTPIRFKKWSLLNSSSSSKKSTSLPNIQIVF